MRPLSRSSDARSPGGSSLPSLSPTPWANGCNRWRTEGNETTPETKGDLCLIRSSLRLYQVGWRAVGLSRCPPMARSIAADCHQVSPSAPRGAARSGLKMSRLHDKPQQNLFFRSVTRRTEVVSTCSPVASAIQSYANLDQPNFLLGAMKLFGSSPDVGF